MVRASAAFSGSRWRQRHCGILERPAPSVSGCRTCGAAGRALVPCPEKTRKTKPGNVARNGMKLSISWLSLFLAKAEARPSGLEAGWKTCPPTRQCRDGRCAGSDGDCAWRDTVWRARRASADHLAYAGGLGPGLIGGRLLIAATLLMNAPTSPCGSGGKQLATQLGWSRATPTSPLPGGRHRDPFCLARWPMDWLHRGGQAQKIQPVAPRSPRAMHQAPRVSGAKTGTLQCHAGQRHKQRTAFRPARHATDADRQPPTGRESHRWPCGPTWRRLSFYLRATILYRGWDNADIEVLSLKTGQDGCCAAAISPAATSIQWLRTGHHLVYNCDGECRFGMLP